MSAPRSIGLPTMACVPLASACCTPQNAPLERILKSPWISSFLPRYLSSLQALPTLSVAKASHVGGHVRGALGHRKPTSSLGGESFGYRKPTSSLGGNGMLAWSFPLWDKAKRGLNWRFPSFWAASVSLPPWECGRDGTSSNLRPGSRAKRGVAWAGRGVRVLALCLPRTLATKTRAVLQIAIRTPLLDLLLRR